MKSVPAIEVQLRDILSAQRKIIVVLADAKSLPPEQLKQAEATGGEIFHDKLALEARLAEQLAALIQAAPAGYLQTIENGLEFIESSKGLYDADRLAFYEVLVDLQSAIVHDGTLPAIKMHKRISEDLDALNEIERTYDKEIAQIFSRFDTRAIVLQREKWSEYTAYLNTLYNRDAILKAYGVISPYSADLLPEDDAEKEIFGEKLPRKTLVLTFDDGPHFKYTEEVAAILKQYDISGTFFDVGRNIGSVDTAGNAKLGKNARIVRSLLSDGHFVGNHSFTHMQLSKLSGDALKMEILNTDLLLKAIDRNRTPIFRFPYGARNREAQRLLRTSRLRSIMWNIDSLDWADPVPKSIADRVLREVDKQGRGIILFHDIQERTVKALPQILDRLIADGYQFAAWDGNDFTVKNATTKTARNTVTTGYANSWAIVIGINDYAKWPKLQYAVNDAEAVRDALIKDFNFLPERTVLLKDGEATRRNILAALHTQLAHDNVHENDRILVFFAGHGATRKLSSGRDLGYIVPADADPGQIATDAIPMTEIQNIAESVTAKHVLFVMDACYSGLGLTRGGNGNFLRENAKRVGRQMLTAGGADQMVADGGPDGHSVFTWTLLQGLNGRADLNGDSLITATELAAYVAPAVSSVSLQTPAFGSLPGSQGGEFVFEIAMKAEYLSEATSQLSGAAIALNHKLESVTPAPPSTHPGKTPVVAPVKVIDLQGKQQILKPAPAVVLSGRQLAQRANDLGLQFYREKRYAEAEAQFTEALKLRPDFALAANNLGFIYYRQNRFAEAARWFEITLQHDPSRAIAYVNLGDAYMNLSQVGKARAAYETYLELAPTGAAAEHARKRLDADKPV